MNARTQAVRWKGDWIGLSAIVLLWMWTLVPLLSVASANARLVEAFSTDEAMQVNLLARALRMHSWNIDFGAYGHLSFNLLLIPLRAFSHVSERTIVIAGRLLGLVSGAGLLIAAFTWARSIGGSLAAWITLTFLVLNPTVYMWAAIVHPDMLQALLLLIALWLTCATFEHPTTARLVAASACAGLAFAAKYSGVFVLPLIFAALVGRRSVTTGTAIETRMRIVRASLFVIGAVVLVAGFSIDADSFIRLITADGHIDVPLPVPVAALVWLIRGAGIVMFAVAVTPWTWRELRQWRQTETVLWGCGVSLATFVAVFVITSPYSLYKLAFIKGLYFEAVRTGAVLNLQWTDDWTIGILVTLGLPVLAGLAGNLVFRHLVDPLKTRWTEARVLLIRTVLLAWIALYIAVLFAPFHELAPHYALPLVVPAAMLAARGTLMAVDVLHDRVPHLHRALGTAVIAGVIGVLAASDVTAIVRTRRSMLAREQEPLVQAGEWLAANVPPECHVAYDYLSYVPPSFVNATGTWGQTPDWLASKKPDIVVIRSDVSGQWKSADGRPSYSACLEDGSCGYRKVFALDPVEIFGRN